MSSASAEVPEPDSESAVPNWAADEPSVRSGSGAAASAGNFITAAAVRAMSGSLGRPPSGAGSRNRLGTPTEQPGGQRESVLDFSAHEMSGRTWSKPTVSNLPRPGSIYLQKTNFSAARASHLRLSVLSLRGLIISNKPYQSSGRVRSCKQHL